MAGLSGPVRSEPPPQLKGVDPVPGSSDDGEVMEATGGNFVPPGVSVGPPLAPSVGSPPNDLSKGLGSWFNEPPGPLRPK